MAAVGDTRRIALGAIGMLCTSLGCVDVGETVGEPGHVVSRGTDEAQSVAAPDVSLDALRDGLFSGNPDLGSGGNACERWSSLDQSQRAVFLLLTDRLFLSDTPDESNVLAHVERVELILGGGDDGQACGSSQNNRLFLALDEYAWRLFVDTWDGAPAIADGGGSSWIKTRDIAGPHDPFDMSTETDSGLRCAGVIELPASRPPTGQAHFFGPGSAVPVERGPRISLPADQRLLEIDHDFDCVHRSNPLCPGNQFDKDYIEHYGEFECAWLPHGCVAARSGCYPPAL